jgi:hypothetical protein
MSRLVLKRASASHSSGTWKDEDYDVLADGKVVGRILEEGSRFGPPELRWGWSATAMVPASPATHGTAATREEAMAKFRLLNRFGHYGGVVMDNEPLPVTPFVDEGPSLPISA